MTDLAEDWAPGTTPGARPFENDIEDLGLCGVQFAPEQVDLLERGSRYRPGPWWDKMNALTLIALDDPLFPGGRPVQRLGVQLRLLGMPALEVDDEQVPHPVIVPAVTEIDCSEYETFDEREPDWRRFPSLLGRTHVYSPYTETLLDALRPIRLWNLWPIEPEDVGLVNESVRRWRRDEWKPWLSWLEASRSQQSRWACDYEGTPEHLHDHEYDDDGFVAACHDAEQWMDRYRQTETVYVDGEMYHRPFGPFQGLQHLEPIWNQLLVSSAANVHAALSSYPEWEQRDVLRTERHYSPWLWSY